jgi:RNA polymerase sigma factor (TIGR02999 family)
MYHLDVGGAADRARQRPPLPCITTKGCGLAHRAEPAYGTDSPSGRLGDLLRRLDRGERTALDELIPLIHDELRLVAHYQRRRWNGDATLGTTALVNEAYLKLVRQQHIVARDRAHFFAIAGRAMRQILSNYATARRRVKRGGAQHRLSLQALEREAAGAHATDAEADAIAALEDALQRLEQVNGRLARVVECRFFSGLSIADTAVALGTSPATVKRDWLLARAWLGRELACDVLVEGADT